MNTNIIKTKNNLEKVVLLGRTNVGKSTLFNKLSEKYLAMVSGTAGTTRDLKYGIISWQDTMFELIDSGGLDIKHLRSKKNIEDNDINREIVNKALEAVKQANLILFVVDAKNGLNIEDREIAKWLLRRKDKKILLVANKVDGKAQRMEIAEFTKLGLGDPLPISATTGSGTGDLLDIIAQKLPQIKRTEKEDTSEILDDKNRNIKIAIIGRPNVGKSTLLNNLTGETRAIVSPIAHTTREPINIQIKYADRNIEIIDTAGMRRKSRIEMKSLEKEGVRLSLKALRHVDIVLFIFDLSDDPGNQDQKLISEILKEKVGLIIVANKVDLLKGRIESNTYTQVEKNIQRTFNFAKWASVSIISALNKKGLPKIFDKVIEVDANMYKEVDQDKLWRIIDEAVVKHPPHKKTTSKMRPKIKNFKQIGVNPPRFVMEFKAKHMIPLSYLQYLEKHIRNNFDFTGTPIIIQQKKL